jgi:hypothetical protein
VNNTNSISTLCLTYTKADGDGSTAVINSGQVITAEAWFKVTLFYGKDTVTKMWYNDNLRVFQKGLCTKI